MFTFHRPETLAEWLRQIVQNPDLTTFRARLKVMPPLDEQGLWGKQAEAIRNLERSLAEDRPRSLIQMATGSGEDVHGGERLLPADQARGRQADLVPGRPGPTDLGMPAIGDSR